MSDLGVTLWNSISPSLLPINLERIPLFPGSVCEILSLNLDEGEESTITGISGEEIKIFIHNIKIKIGEEKMDIRAGFCVREDIPYLLGRTDILSHFDICFESDKVCFIVK